MGTYGVGMPIVAYFSQNITDPSAFMKATTVTVNGAPANGAWYFEANGDATKPMAAHYRTQNYWHGGFVGQDEYAGAGFECGSGFDV